MITWCMPRSRLLCTRPREQFCSTIFRPTLRHRQCLYVRAYHCSPWRQQQKQPPKDNGHGQIPPKVKTSASFKTSERINIESHKEPVLAKFEDVPQTDNLLGEQKVSNKEQRKADWAILKEMAKYLWPKVEAPGVILLPPNPVDIFQGRPGDQGPGWHSIRAAHRF